jgi:predicted protein tyrosine phosphatase
MFSFSNDVAFGGFKQRKAIDADDWVVINVSNRSFEDDDYHVPLNDGAFDNGGNSQEEFAEAVNVVRERIQEEEPVFVYCAHGESRSVSVLATAIAAEQEMDFERARDELMDIRGSEYEPASSLQKKAKAYLIVASEKTS